MPNEDNKHEYHHCRVTPSRGEPTPMQEYMKDLDRIKSKGSIDDALILETPTQIELFHLFQMKYTLKIEIAAGLTENSIFNEVNTVLVRNNWIQSPLLSRKAALEALDAYIETKTKALTDDPA